MRAWKKLLLGLITIPLCGAVSLCGTARKAGVSPSWVSWEGNDILADGVLCTAGSADLSGGAGGPTTRVFTCADNDASTLYGSTPMPAHWNGGFVTFSLYGVQLAAEVATVAGDLTVVCRGEGIAFDGYGTETALDVTTNGSAKLDVSTTLPFSPDGSCAAGDELAWRWQIDATGTDATMLTYLITGFRMEFN